MFSTKKDIDRHVKTSLAKLPENEKFLRGLAVARQYFKIGEYASAEYWLSCFISVQEDSAPAHKLLGQCYEKQKKFDRAITAYQRSLQLDSKQTGLITDVCKLLLSDDNFSKNLSKAKHWCDLAENERINHEAVLNLKLKVANKDVTVDNKLVKDIILKEILSRPLDPGLRIRLVKHFIDEKKIEDAFKYCFDVEMKLTETFQQSIEWANAISSMLTKYVEQNANSYQTNWHYWLILVTVLDRQIYLNLLADSSLYSIMQNNFKEIASLLFELDQSLKKFSDKGRNACPHKQLADEFLRHYRGQLMLHSASLLFKHEKQGSKTRDVTGKCLPLLFLAYQCGVPDSEELWLKQANENTRQLIAYWKKQASFRCCQTGYTILSCLDKNVDASVIAQIQSVTDCKIWNTAEDLVNQVRSFCSDVNWKRSIFRSVYCNNGDQVSKMSSSYFMQSSSIIEPEYTLPKREHLQLYLEVAQYLFPSSLQYQVYLGLGMEDLSDMRCKSFKGLNFSTNNLENCSVDTLNQLDIDSFLCCSILVAKSCIERERRCQDKFDTGKPLLLPAPNLMPGLCEENKIDWWNAACAVFRNVKPENFVANKQLLQHGLQAVRGTGTPLTDVIVLLKLGKILAKRASATIAPDERRQIELRTENVYKAGVFLWKIRNETTFVGSNVFFKYGIDSFECSQEAVKLAEDALTYLAGVYFKHGRYEEFTQDFGGIPLPFAAYFRAEAFKKLDESNKTPLKTKKFYSERARDCIKQTQKYLELPYIEKSHPLHYVISSEMKRLQFNESLDGSLNTSTNGWVGGGADDSDHFQSFSSSTNTGMNKSDRETSARTNELENLIRKMMDTLNIVKEDVLNIRNDVGDIQERLVKIEDNIHKRPADDEGATAVLNDLYILDELQNPSYVNQAAYNSAIQQQLTPNMPPPTSRMPPHPAAVALQQPNPYQSFYNTSYPMYMQQYTQQGRAQIGSVASPMHTYQDNLLVAASPAAYYAQPPQPPLQQVPLPPQQPIPPSVSTQKPNSFMEQALQTSSLLNTWNSTYNSNVPVSSVASTVPTPLDRAPPVNVVITNSDPLPTHISVGATPPTYSVTIPPQHIKHSAVSSTPTIATTIASGSGIENVSPITINTKYPLPTLKASEVLSVFGSSINTSSTTTVNDDDDEPRIVNVSGEYDPQPDFKPIIPLPDEVEVRTGEEDEEQVFCGRAKLFRMVNKEWKERGLGDLKILKSKTEPSRYRIVMRRDQVHKIAANHSITAELIIEPMETNSKCYTWAAMDFADEEPKKETFSARFATVELAKEFFNKFNEVKNEVARLKKLKEASSKVDSSKGTGFSFGAPKTDSTTATATKPLFDPQTTKPIFGTTTSSLTVTTTASSTPFHGFTFSNNQTPKFQPPAQATLEEKNNEPTKPSPFASFSFAWTNSPAAAESTPEKSTANNNKSLTDIFSSLNKLSNPAGATNTPVHTSVTVTKTPDKNLNTSTEEAVEDFVPTTDFKPVIPLPDIVEVKTGEEDFDCVYEHRAKLYRLDKEAKEWKERGIGNIRVLVKKDDNNVARLLMRREQVLKLCCNQLITKDLKFTVNDKNNSLLWIGHDYSEGELVIESFAIRFKTPEIRNDFHAIIKKVQSAMTSSKTGKETVKKDDKKTEPKGFGDKFKPKAGSWNCESCYVTNKAEDVCCVSCNTPKDGTAPNKPNTLLDNSNKSSTKFSFGKQASSDTPKFSFGIPPSTVASEPVKLAEPKKKDEVKGFGDKFKPKAGSWSCSSCYINNKSDDLYCVACQTPQNPTVGPKFNFSSGGGFTFGIPASTAATSGLTASITPTTSELGFAPATGGGFSFGNVSVVKTTDTTAAMSTSSTTVNTTSVSTTTTPSFKFELPKPTMSFGSKLSSNTTAVTPESSPQQVTSSNSTKVSAPEKATFEFVFKPKSPGKSKSPGRTLSTSSANEDPEGEDVSGECAEEENNTYFTPVIPLPEKIEVKTGEEDEEALYSHRAKLFRFVDKEWKERGIGDVKILKHRTTGKLRVVMRRDQVLKICLNHVLDSTIKYQKKDSKSWQFVANDFSEGSFEVMNFCLRFKTSDIADQFKDSLDQALRGEAITPNPSLDSSISTPTTPFNILQCSDITLGEDELISELKLPVDFFVSPKQPCSGCRGCDPDSFVFPSYDNNVNSDLIDEQPLPVDVKNVKHTPLNVKLSKSPKKVSFTSENEDEKLRNIFSSVSTTTTTKSQLGSGNFVAAEKQSSNTPIFGSVTKSEEAPKTFFGDAIFGSKSTTTPSTGSIFSSSLNTTPKTALITPQTTTDKPSLLKPSLFGSSSPGLNNSAEGVQLFGGAFSQKTNSPSIFGGTTTTAVSSIVPENTATPTSVSSTPVFGSTGSNIFGGFGSTTSTPGSNTVGSDKNSFGALTMNSGISFADAAKGFDKKADGGVAPFGSSFSVSSTTFKTEEGATDILKKSDGCMTFASLTAEGSNATFLTKKTSTDSGFVGLTVKEDIFSRNANKGKTENDDPNDDSATATDDNYDPHYEPIIQLPDKIEVRTGEEEELKLFGDRAKLYRYDSETKEWKERGVGELKILHHPGRNSYRLLMRREQVFKLVLNHAITHDVQITPMNNSGKAFVWGAMNHAEEGPQLEKLAARFKNEDVAAAFKSALQQCQDKLQQKSDLEPDQD